MKLFNYRKDRIVECINIRRQRRELCITQCNFVSVSKHTIAIHRFHGEAIHYFWWHKQRGKLVRSWLAFSINKVTNGLQKGLDLLKAGLSHHKMVANWLERNAGTVHHLYVTSFFGGLVRHWLASSSSICSHLAQTSSDYCLPAVWQLSTFIRPTNTKQNNLLPTGARELKALPPLEAATQDLSSHHLDGVRVEDVSASLQTQTITGSFLSICGHVNLHVCVCVCVCALPVTEDRQKMLGQISCSISPQALAVTLSS